MSQQTPEKCKKSRSYGDDEQESGRRSGEKRKKKWACGYKGKNPVCRDLALLAGTFCSLLCNFFFLFFQNCVQPEKKITLISWLKCYNTRRGSKKMVQGRRTKPKFSGKT